MLLSVRQESDLKYCIDNMLNAASQSIKLSYNNLDKSQYIIGNIYPSAYGRISVIIIDIYCKLEIKIANKMKDSNQKEAILNIIKRLKNLNIESMRSAEKYYDKCDQFRPDSIYPYAFGYAVCELLVIASELEQILKTKE